MHPELLSLKLAKQGVARGPVAAPPCEGLHRVAMQNQATAQPNGGDHGGKQTGGHPGGVEQVVVDKALEGSQQIRAEHAGIEELDEDFGGHKHCEQTSSTTQPTGHAAETFTIEVRPGPSISATLSTPPAAPASTMSYRRVMDRQWLCDICNTKQPAQTGAQFWDHHPKCGSFAICGRCHQSGRSPDEGECTLQ